LPKGSKRKGGGGDEKNTTNGKVFLTGGRKYTEPILGERMLGEESD